MNTAIETVPKSDLDRVFALQSKQQWITRRSTAEQRIERLKKLRAAIEQNEPQVREALYKDLRKGEESAQGEVLSCYIDIDHTIAELADWMAQVDVETPAVPSGRGKLVYEARGIVLLFGPWNYPFSLVFQPLAAIIAAGNCALVKPNEVAPHVSAVTAKIIREAFVQEEVAVFEGDVDLANDLLALPVDHIFFTGSPAVGKVIMSAAAKHLASVTLELGGKNPVVIGRDANLQDAAGKVAFMRNMNSGQVCLCPENIYLPEEMAEDFIAVAQGTFQAMFYQDGELNTEATGKIIDQRNLERIRGYLDDAREKGATIVCGGEVVEESLSVHPTILANVPENARILSEETFGPILSIFTYKDVEEVYESLHKQPKPLALYVFSQDDQFVEDVLSNTASGGVTVNNCMMHVIESNLPFGGVNSSGIGRYHGIHGFKELSHERAVLYTPLES